MPLQARDFVHPEDAAALQELEAVPGLQAAIAGVFKLGGDRFFHCHNMANKVRVGPRQLPRLHGHLVHACERLEIEEPELYVELDRQPNAYTSGDTKAFVSVSTGLLEVLKEDEVATVIGHECGHIKCRHVRYHTAGDLIALLADSLPFVSDAVRLALLYWSRRSELSADRAAAFVMGDGGVVVRTMMKLAGGGHEMLEELALAEFARQAEEVDAFGDDGQSKLLLGLAALQLTHPFPAVRAREIARWVSSAEFARLLDAAVADRCECGVRAVEGDRFCSGCGAPREA